VIRRKITLYVTKWVLARGILKVNAELIRTQGQHAMKDWYSMKLPGHESHRHTMVAIGKDAFLTLPEAEANALEQVQSAAEEAQARATKLTGDVVRTRLGEMQVHDMTLPGVCLKVSDLHAFGPDEVGSTQENKR
jgi:hypothetical protein